jgi:plastocyanin
MRVFRAVAILVIASSLAMEGTAFATPALQVDVHSFFFSPKTPTFALTPGQDVNWTNVSASDATPADHTTTSDIALWDHTLPEATTGTFDETFAAAGKFTYHCTFHPSMTGVVFVAMTATGPFTKGVPFTITWASTAVPSRFHADVQFSPPPRRHRRRVWKNTAFIDQTGSNVSGSFTAARAGKFLFRARLVNDSTSGASGFSPPVAVVVSP